MATVGQLNLAYGRSDCPYTELAYRAALGKVSSAPLACVSKETEEAKAGRAKQKASVEMSLADRWRVAIVLGGFLIGNASSTAQFAISKVRHTGQLSLADDWSD